MKTSLTWTWTGEIVTCCIVCSLRMQGVIQESSNQEIEKNGFLKFYMRIFHNQCLFFQQFLFNFCLFHCCRVAISIFSSFKITTLHHIHRSASFFFVYVLENFVADEPRGHACAKRIGQLCGAARMNQISASLRFHREQRAQL